MVWKLKKRYPKDWLVVDHDITIVDDEQYETKPKTKSTKKPQTKKTETKLESKQSKSKTTKKIKEDKQQTKQSKPKDDIDDFKLTFKSVKKKKTKFPITQYNNYIQDQIHLVSKQHTVDDVRRLFAKASRRYSRYPDYENALLQGQIHPQYYYGCPILSWIDDLEKCKQRCIELLNMSIAK